MATSRGKKQENFLQNQQQSTFDAIKPTPVEDKLSANTLNFLNDADGGKDIRDIAGMKPFLNLYDSATGQQADERQSNGILNLANPNPQAANALKSYYSYKRQQDAAGQVENAYNQSYANYTGQIAPMLINSANGRQMGKAQLAQQQYQAYLARPQQPSWFDRISKLAMGGAQMGAIAAGAAV